VIRRRVLLLHAAQLDVVEHMAHLDEQREGLGTVRFAAALVARLAALETDCMWPVVHRERAIRVAPMDPPWEKYGIFFSVDDDEIRVRAVFHFARNVRRHLRVR
jgi:hypothetical protein